MAAVKWQNDSMLDAALNYIKNNAVRLIVCAEMSEPPVYGDIATDALATATISSSDFTGPAAGDTSGRKLTVNQQSDITISATGTAVQIALTNGSDTLYYVTTCTSQSLESGGTVTVPAWDIEIRDAA